MVFKIKVVLYFVAYKKKNYRNVQNIFTSIRCRKYTKFARRLREFFVLLKNIA